MGDFECRSAEMAGEYQILGRRVAEEVRVRLSSGSQGLFSEMLCSLARDGESSGGRVFVVERNEDWISCSRNGP